MEILLMVYINSERILNQKRTLLAYKTELTLAKHIANTYSEEELYELSQKRPELASTVMEILYDPDQIECALESIVVPTQEELKILDKLASANMRRFLYAALPKALWRRELDLELSTLEQLLLCEEIPNTALHGAWIYITNDMKKKMERYFDGHCRECGKGGHICCRRCNGVYFCSSACLKKDIQDRTLGHFYVECQLIQTQLPR